MGKIGRAISERITVLREMLWRPWVKIAGVLVFLAGLWSTFRAEVLSEETAKNLQLYRIVKLTGGLVPLWIWVVVLAGIVVAAAVEYSLGLRRQIAVASSPDRDAPEILDARLFQHSPRKEMFDLFVPTIVHDRVGFRNEWGLDLRLGDGRVVTGLRGETDTHGFSLPNHRYDMTVSFPLGASIPSLAALAGATVLRLSAVDIKKRTAVFEPLGGLPLAPCEEKEQYSTGPAIAVEITSEVRNDIPHHAGYVPYVWGLTVRNDGDTAEFQATVKLLSGATTTLPQARAHRLSFREGLKQRLVPGAEDYVFFAMVVWNGVYGGVIAKALWHYDETARRDDSALLIPIDGKTQADNVVDFEVVIVSDPGMSLPWKRRYRLGPGNELHDVTQSALSSVRHDDRQERLYRIVCALREDLHELNWDLAKPGSYQFNMEVWKRRIAFLARMEEELPSLITPLEWLEIRKVAEEERMEHRPMLKTDAELKRIALANEPARLSPPSSISNTEEPEK